ncbi:MAG: GNAT family N-acetyltransferase [Dactylosporangium sp.]|nr:GNAT family N-acetyltransferase [Dactylosporangium sp.]
MDLPWNRLGPLIRVPYLPTLGAIHPGSVGPVVWAEVLDVAGTGRWLPHDKDARWGGVKPESVIDTTAGDGHALVATLLRRDTDQGTIRVHCYGPPTQRVLDEARVLNDRLMKRHQAGKGHLVWFLPPGHAPRPEVAATRIQLRTFANAQTPVPSVPAEPGRSVAVYDALPPPVAATFAAFAQTMADDGFAFLYQRMLTDDPGPVLTVTADQRVVGAIGPMAILADPTGRSRLLPQYFGVLPTHRGRGLGRALWRAAMAWGAANGADYQILNTVIGGASDRLCRAEGLTDLGIVRTTGLTG